MGSPQLGRLPVAVSGNLREGGGTFRFPASLTQCYRSEATSALDPWGAVEREGFIGGIELDFRREC